MTIFKFPTFRHPVYHHRGNAKEHGAVSSDGGYSVHGEFFQANWNLRKSVHIWILVFEFQYLNFSTLYFPVNLLPFKPFNGGSNLNIIKHCKNQILWTNIQKQNHKKTRHTCTSNPDSWRYWNSYTVFDFQSISFNFSVPGTVHRG